MLKNLENMKDKHTGSMTAIIIGILLFVSGITTIAEGLSSNSGAALLVSFSHATGGLSLALGALAYRMAKKRKLGIVNPTVIRLVIEVASIVLAMLVIFLQNDIAKLMVAQPLTNALIPMGVLIAYLSIIFQK